MPSITISSVHHLPISNLPVISPLLLLKTHWNGCRDYYPNKYCGLPMTIHFYKDSINGWKIWKTGISRLISRFCEKYSRVPVLKIGECYLKKSQHPNHQKKKQKQRKKLISPNMQMNYLIISSRHRMRNLDQESIIYSSSKESLTSSGLPFSNQKELGDSPTLILIFWVLIKSSRARKVTIRSEENT